MKNYLVTVLFVLLIGSNLCSEAQTSNSHTLQNVIREIAKLNIYETTCTVGYANVSSSHFQLFKLLTVLATDEELITLAEGNKNAVVRLYCYQALKKRNIKIPSSLFEKFKSDENEITSLQGCLAENTTVNKLQGEIFISSTNYTFTKEY